MKWQAVVFNIENIALEKLKYEFMNLLSFLGFKENNAHDFTNARGSFEKYYYIKVAL
jgi:hypothetical protein